MIVTSSVGRSVVDEIAHRVLVDEHLHVPPQRAAFVDDAEPDAGIAPIELGEQRLHGIGVDVHDRQLIRVRAQRSRNADVHALQSSERVARIREFQRVDLGEMLGDARPPRAFIDARPHVSARRPEVHADGIPIVDGHRLTLHGEPRALG